MMPAAPRPGLDGAGWAEPLRLTLVPWHNERRRDTGAWIKKLALKGVRLHQFGYGSITRSPWRRRDLQWGQLCTEVSRVFAVDVDYPDQYAATRTGRLLGRRHAMTTRDERFHVWVDGRGIPAGQWPGQCAIAGADIRSNSFVPVPGCWHYSGPRYEPVPGAVPVPAWPGLLQAIEADAADEAERFRALLRRWGLDKYQDGPAARGRGGRCGGTNPGHDTWVAGRVLAMRLRGLTREQAYAEWRQIAVALRPGWPYTDADFERHWSRVDEKAAEIREREAADAAPFASWALGGAR